MICSRSASSAGLACNCSTICLNCSRGVSALAVFASISTPKNRASNFNVSFMSSPFTFSWCFIFGRDAFPSASHYGHIDHRALPHTNGKRYRDGIVFDWAGKKSTIDSGTIYHSIIQPSSEAAFLF